MTRIVFLPRAEDGANDWQQSGDVFRLNEGDIRANLAPPKRLSAEGIPSPWAARDFMKWRLEDQKSGLGREGTRILRALVLLQFLRLMEGEEVALQPGAEGFRRLARVLLRPAHDPERRVTVWKSNLPELKKYRVVAGSTTSCPFFPAGSVAPEDLFRALGNAVGPTSPRPLVDGDGNVLDSSLAASLAGYLERLSEKLKGSVRASDFANALGTWRDELSSIGGTALPTIKLPISIGDSGASQVQLEWWSDSVSWNCPKCQSEGTRWIDQPLGGPRTSITIRVTAAGCEVRCPKHPAESINCMNGVGNAVGYDELGCYRAGEKLYIWNEESAFPKNRTGPSQVGDGFVEHPFNLVRIRLEGELIRLDQVLLDQGLVAWPSKGVGADGLEKKTAPEPADVPVLARYAFLVKSCERDARNQRWVISLYGYSAEIERKFPSTPSSALWENSAILVWPPQEADTWGIDYVVASAPRSESLRFKIVSERSGSRVYDVSEPRMLLGLYRTEGSKVRYIELGEVTTGTYRAMGLMKVTRGRIHAGVGARADVVIDFGTSNSAVLWKLTDRSSQFLQSGIEEIALPEHACRVTYSPFERGQLERAAAVLLSWYPEARSQPFVPALLAEPDREHVDGKACIPPRKEGIAILRQSGGDLDGSRVRVGLKWKDWADPRTKQSVERLFEALLIPALWEMCRRGVTQWSLRATYPLAFETESLNKRAMYSDIVNSLVKSLCVSGLTTSAPESVSLFSESEAGAASLQKPNSTFEVTLDLGGGTLDVAVLVGPAGSELCGLPSGTVVAADSLVYGGRDFLRAIVTAYGQYLLPEPMKEMKSGDQAALELEQLECDLHERGIEGLLDKLNSADSRASRDGKSPNQDRKWRWEALIAGVSLYVKRLLEGVISARVHRVDGGKEPPGITVGFYLLGQGWELLRLREPASNVREIMERRLKRICAAVEESTGVKIVQPVVQIPFGEVDPKTAVVLGALNLKTRDITLSSGSYAHESEDQAIRDSFLGMKLGDDGNALTATTPLRELRKEARPSASGDPGYAALLEDLWQEVPEDRRADVRNWLVRSEPYRRARSAPTVEDALILEGQTSYGNAWPPGDRPKVSLLGEFLSKVWRRAWTEFPL
jgi:hypothetical protein